MIVRLDFGGEVRRQRTLRLAPSPGPDVRILASLGPHLPFRDNSVDEIFLDRVLAHTEEFLGTMEEIWRVSKPGTIIHVRLPHTSSAWALSRDPLHSQHFTLETEERLLQKVGGALKLCYASRQPLALCLTPMLHGGKIA